MNGRPGARVRGSVMGAGLLTLASLLPSGDPVLGAAPPPPPDACLSQGSFNIADGTCTLYWPEVGARYGPIAGIDIRTVERGVPVTLAAPGGVDIEFDPPPGKVCGERGCPRVAISWRRGQSFHHGIGFIEGCGARDITCTVTYAPPLVGDDGEIYQVVYAEQYLGIQPTGNSRMYALYTPPTVYPVRLDPVDTSGARVQVPSDFVAYAVREGTDPTQADCDTTPWIEAALVSATVPIPDCTTFSRSGSLSGGDDHFSGFLPNDSGTWIVVGAPRGDAGAPLLSRPSPYRHTTLTPRNDDLVGTIVAERRPGLSMEVRPETTVMDLGTTQMVDVIVAAQGGEAGALERLTFEDAGVLALTGTDAALEIVDISEVPPAGGFALGVGEQRVFAVELRAVGLGEGAIRAAVAGMDDLGQALRVDQGGPILVEYADDALAGGAEAPSPPVVARALDAGAGATDVIEGTVAGAPGTTVTVSLASSPVPSDDTCSRSMSGEGVTGLGSFRVTIEADGTGRFSRAGTLEPGRYVYGVTASGPAVSAGGECTLVSEATPSIEIDDTEVAEGSGKGTTSLIFTIRLSSPSESTVTVDVASSDGSATAPDDYRTLAPTTITFPTGEVSASIAIDVAQDKQEEPDEDLVVTLSNPVGATSATGTATGTIVNDDGAGDTTDGDLDLRGRWTFEPIPPDPDGQAWIDVRSWDAASGTLTGIMTVVFEGRTFTEKMTGTLKGDRLSLVWESAKGNGTLVTRNGKPSAVITGKDAGGDTFKGRLTLTRPRGD